MSNNYELQCRIDNGTKQLITNMSVKKFIKLVGDLKPHTFEFTEISVKDGSRVDYKVIAYIEKCYTDNGIEFRLQQYGKDNRYSCTIYSIIMGNGTFQLVYGTRKTKRKRRELIQHQEQERIEQQQIKEDRITNIIYSKISTLSYEAKCSVWEYLQQIKVC